jgi:uroporphyrinogen decarboxylase
MQGYWALNLAGVSFNDFLSSPSKAAKAQMSVVDDCGFDGIETMWDWSAPLAESLGCEIKQPDFGVGSTWTHILDNQDALDRLQVPNPEKDRRLSAAMSVTEVLVDRLSKAKFLYMTITAPYTLLGELRGVDKLMMDTFMDRDFVNNAIKFLVESTNSYLEHMMKSGVDAILLCDPNTSGAMISPEDFVAFAQPSLRECGKTVKNAGGRFMVYICEDTTDRLREISETGADAFSLDHAVDLPSAANTIGDRMVLIGNIDPARILFNGTKEQVYDTCSTRIKEMEGKRYILSAGCDLMPGTPLQNVQMMHKARIDA